MSDLHRLNIKIKSPTEFCAWAKESMPGAVIEVVAFEDGDGHYDCTIVFDDPDSLVLVKMFWTNAPS